MVGDIEAKCSVVCAAVKVVEAVVAESRVVAAAAVRVEQQIDLLTIYHRF